MTGNEATTAAPSTNQERMILLETASFGPRWQTDVAKALGVSDRMVRSWLAGKGPVSDGVIHDLQSVVRERIQLMVQALESSEASIDDLHAVDHEKRVRSTLATHDLLLGRRDPAWNYDWTVVSGEDEIVGRFPSLVAVVRGLFGRGKRNDDLLHETVREDAAGTKVDQGTGTEPVAARSSTSSAST